jgi:hypothetical protein
MRWEDNINEELNMDFEGYDQALFQGIHLTRQTKGNYDKRQSG